MIYLGDAAGTSADEVGTAMQRSAAAADAFGLSFEWLGAYIATVSEKTRLAPEVIGTAFNSILARMHSIKEKGYNEEDETQINDVAKALDKVNVALLDQDKSWRDASDIFADVAVQWDTLDAKTQAYIATVIAGARNQNVFLTLMNDMSKAAEGNSRAVELYNGALNSAGTTAAKYAIWQESVAAAQGQLTAALQDFYALLNADWLKGFYSGMADLVGLMTSGTEALRGWNILLPVLGVGLMSVVSIIMKVVTAIQAASGAVGVLTALTGGALPALLAVAGLAAGVVTAVAGISKQAVTPADYSGQIDDLSSHIDRVKALRDEYAELTATQDRSQAESQRMKQIIDELSGSSLTLKYALAGTTDGFLDQTDALKTLNAYLIETSNRLIQLKREEAALSFKDVESIREAQDRVNQADKQESLWKEYDAFKGTDHYKQGVSFSQYVRGKIMEYSDIEHFDEQMKWAELDDMLNNLVDGFFVWDDQITAALENLNLHAQGSAENARSQMESVWQTYADLLRVFAVGPQYDGMNSYFKEQMDAYANRLIDGFDLNTEVTGERLTEAGNKLLAKQAELAAMLENDTTLRDLFKNYDELMPQIDPEDLAALDDLNAVVEKINEILATKNESLPDGEKLALLPVLDTTG